jgi:hypothetical protein
MGHRGIAPSIAAMSLIVSARHFAGYGVLIEMTTRNPVSAKVSVGA